MRRYSLNCRYNIMKLQNLKIKSLRDNNLHFIIVGIFAPDRFGIAKYPEDIGYDISILRDNFRSLIVLKSNLSRSNVEIPFYFDGGASILRELPPPSEMKDIYTKIRNKTIYTG